MLLIMVQPPSWVQSVLPPDYNLVYKGKLAYSTAVRNHECIMSSKPCKVVTMYSNILRLQSYVEIEYHSITHIKCVTTFNG